MHIVRFIILVTIVLLLGFSKTCSAFGNNSDRSHIGLELDMLVYSNGEIGVSPVLSFYRKEGNRSLGFAPLFITDKENIRPGGALLYRLNFNTEKSKYVSFFAEIGGQYYEANQGQRTFTKTLLLTQGVGFHVKYNEKDAIGVFYGMGIDSGSLFNPNKQIALTGMLRVSWYFSDLFRW